MIEKAPTRKKVVWDDTDKQTIAEEVYERLMTDITTPLIKIVQDYCSKMTPVEKRRKIPSLQSIPWLKPLIERIHAQRLKDVTNVKTEVINLRTKEKQRMNKKEPTQEERIKKTPTSMLVYELVTRMDERLGSLEHQIKSLRL